MCTRKLGWGKKTEKLDEISDPLHEGSLSVRNSKLRKVCTLDKTVPCSPHPVVASDIAWFHNSFLFICSRL